MNKNNYQILFSQFKQILQKDLILVYKLYKNVCKSQEKLLIHDWNPMDHNCILKPNQDQNKEYICDLYL